MANLVYKFHGENNVDDPTRIDSTFNPRIQKTYCEVASLVNVDTSPDGDVQLRNGFSQVLAGAFHSAREIGGRVYLVNDGWIKTFNGTGLSGGIAAVSPSLPVAFCKVGDVVAYSNGVDFGVIENGVVTPPLTPSAPFKVRMHPGQLLEFYNGRLYSFYNETLYCSDSLDSGGGIEQMDSRDCVVAVFDTQGTMLKATSSGLWVGTRDETVFLRGGDPIEGFDFVPIVSYGVSLGSPQTAGEGTQDGKNTIIWASERGICTGGDSGEFSNKSLGKIAYNFGDGPGLLREQNGAIHYLCTMNTTQPAYNKLESLNITQE